MKKFLLAVAILFAAQFVAAAPYFRLIDPKHPVVSAGVFADPIGSAMPDAGSSVALIIHKAGEGGSIIESIQTDWTPLGIGGGYGNGQAFMAVGPSANMAPVVKSGALSVLNAIAKDGQYQNLKSLLAPASAGGPDISIAFGPAFVVKPMENGGLVPMNKWRGLFRVFVGAAWSF